MSTRIDKACNLLRSTELSVIAVSEQVGFHSISSFNRCFSKITGHSPRSWRNLIHTASQETKDKQIILDFNGWTHPEKLYPTECAEINEAPRKVRPWRGLHYV